MSLLWKTSDACPETHNGWDPNITCWVCPGCGATIVDMQDWPVHMYTDARFTRTQMENVLAAFTPEAMGIVIAGMAGDHE